MTINYVSANSLSYKIDRFSDLVSRTTPPPGSRTAKIIVNNATNVTSVASGFGTGPVAGNALFFQGTGYRLGITNAAGDCVGPWGATASNSTDGGLNNKLGFTSLGQYTIECFIRWTGTGGIGQEGWYESGGSGCTVGATSSFIYNGISGNSYGAQFSYAIQRGTWYHIAMTRFHNGSNQINQCWVNGTQIGTGVALDHNYTGQNPFGGAVSPYIGGGNGATSGFAFSGYIQEYRISNIRRYTANFNPTTVPFSNDANTVLLLHGSSPTADDNQAN